jgi:hypothetical protein
LTVYSNSSLRRIFGPKRDEVTGEWRRLHNEELHDLYLSPTVVLVIKSRRMRWAAHVARLGKGRGNLRERDHWVDPDVNGRILRWVFRKCHLGVWTGLGWLRIETGGGHL